MPKATWNGAVLVESDTCNVIKQGRQPEVSGNMPPAGAVSL
ncbi:hypothetical protein [Leptolyngbya sp. Heron Island J]|nr:hypothetical protein [Leptolyngbya sp. Heron Island J]